MSLVAGALLGSNFIAYKSGEERLNASNSAFRDSNDLQKFSVFSYGWPIPLRNWYSIDGTAENDFFHLRDDFYALLGDRSLSPYCVSNIAIVENVAVGLLMVLGIGLSSEHLLRRREGRKT